MTVNCKYHECDYEKAVLELLQNQGWQYTGGYDIHRKNDEILLKDDLQQYLTARYGIFSPDELGRIAGYVVGGEHQSLYNNMKTAYTRLMRGYTLHRDDDTTLFIEFFDMEDGHCSNNIFRAVNQFEVDGYKKRIPDIVLFINGIPVSVFELKNPADEDVSIADAYTQTHVRYCKDIPDLMRFDFINVISDGANTKYGSLFSDYEFYFVWKSTDGKDYAADAQGIVLTHTLIAGLFAPATLLRVLHDYIYFPDNSSTNLVILPKYYQYYGTEELFASILKAHRDGSGKGGTYWGATGCGKSYTMLFLTRRITTSVEMNKPTVILLTDRNDLDEQLSTTFENAKGYLVDDNTLCITSREMLRKKLFNIQSGGIFLMTIQKFSEGIQLLSPRSNIVCISDEAHRTQTNTEAHYKTVNGQTKKSYGFAKYLRDSFPNATYVGFTGTPIDATLRVFGSVVSKYTMRQSLADGATVQIARLPGPREVRVDDAILKICDEYYNQQLKDGANEFQIEKSKREMSRLKQIIGSPSRLDVVVNHFIWHYEKRCEEASTVCGKAMFVCYDCQIAYDVYKRIKALRPEWFVKRKCAPEYDGQQLDHESMEIEKVKLVCTNDKDDPKELDEILGNNNDRKNYAKAFKDVLSNFKIAIVVDMWITGFDVPSLDTMYLDKPVELHNLIQTISRVNRVYKGKQRGLVVDYIGLENAIAAAMKMYDGDQQPINGVDTSLRIFKDHMKLLADIMHSFDFSIFLNPNISPVARLNIIQSGVEYVMQDERRKAEFMGYSRRAKKAYDVCIGHPDLTQNEIDTLHYYMCVRSVIYKMTKTGTPDATLMNRKVAEYVDKAIRSTYSENTFGFEGASTDGSEDILTDEFLKKLSDIPYPNTRFQALLKLLRQAIKMFSDTNNIKATVFSQRLKKVVDRYNARNDLGKTQAVVDDVVDGLSAELQKIFSDLKTEQNSYQELGITYDEKAFYDILISVAEKHQFKEQLSEDKYIYLAKEIKKLVANKSKYTDWTNRQDVKDELYTDVAILLNKNGFPPQPIDEAYDEIMKQVDNYKKNHDSD